VGIVRHELITSAKPHHQALEIMAAKALAEEDFVTAFKLADRRCRIEPPPQSHSYVLRADASYKLGDQSAALADATAALQASPRDLASIRRLFSWGNHAQRLAAASDLTDLERDVATLRAAIKLLAENGRRRLANLSVFDGYITGWAVWDQDEPAELTITSMDGAITSLLAPDPFHALSSQSFRATSFHLARPASPQPQTASIAVSGDRFFAKRMPPNQRDRNARGNPSKARQSVGALPTVIVPVYADFEATRACLESLIADRSAGKSYQVMIVNDASPDQEICDYLRTFAKHPHVEILTNPFNLGFVGSVNTALGRLSGGDVILLNADTIVPPGFINRMSAVARDGDDIGTIVPLSNNSEITDFPLPFHNNPLGSYAEIVRLDRLAAKANKNTVIELPNGTGFCLYITRACLDAMGGLSESFQRGYLEDIDFCLRAREHGFRNVCAPSVYVGHAGSRSFQGEKRALVLHNLDLLDQRFPHVRAESAAFVAADPVRPARQAIERLMPISQQRPVLILTGPGAVDAIAQARAQQLVSQGHAAIMLALRDHGTQLCFRSVDRTVPQSLPFALSSKWYRSPGDRRHSWHSRRRRAAPVAAPTTSTCI
jgi:O-antigen biosynthesis protein